MKSPAAILAAIAVRRPAVLVAAALALAAASALVLRSHHAFDSEILNLLPADSPAVEGLKIYNARFNSARELAFIVESPDDSLSAGFVEALAAQPWVLRVLDGPPNASQAGRDTLPQLIAPLLLAQQEMPFDATAENLDAQKVRARIADLAARTAAGSPIARIELENDPLGIVSSAAAQLSSRLSISDTFELVAGDTRIVPVITNLRDLSAEASSSLMAEVHAFIDRFREEAGADAPQISVTGRSAYVDEISSSMQRDITTTSIVSILAVTVLFWFSFRSLLPLIGSVLILALTCLVSLAAGALLFDKLNIVAMGFCSILVGLGDDFSLLLYQRFLAARKAGASREAAIRESIATATPGIFWVALTTGLGFATLLFSGSGGFGQLGALIAIGVVLGAIGMIILMPLFERHGTTPPATDPTNRLCDAFLDRRVTLASLLVLGLAAVIAILPWRPLQFDTSTQSLEPRDIPAAKALARMMTAFPSTFEPVMVVIPGPANRAELRDLDERLDSLRTRGLVESFSSPSPLAFDEADTLRNLTRIRALDIEELERTIREAAQAANLKPGSLDAGTRLLRELQSGAPLLERLSPSSPWWFALDRSIAPGTGDVIFYIRLTNPESANDRRLLESEVLASVPRAMVTGWSQMLHDLVPWATRELVVFGSLVIVIIAIVLMLTYRDKRLLALHFSTLALAIGGTVTTLKLAGAEINLLNVLAFPLILAVGVDYGVHLILASRESGDPDATVRTVMKPVLISGLTTMTGFGALTLASNPALSGLGLVCATGVAWCLFASLCFLAPTALRLQIRGTPKP